MTIFIDDALNDYVGRQLMMIVLEKDKIYKNICTRPTHVIVENNWVGKNCFLLLFSVFLNRSILKDSKKMKKIYTKMGI